MDNIDIFANNEKVLQILKQTIRSYNQDIGIKFQIENVPCL